MKRNYETLACINARIERGDLVEFMDYDYPYKEWNVGLIIDVSEEEHYHFEILSLQGRTSYVRGNIVRPLTGEGDIVRTVKDASEENKLITIEKATVKIYERTEDQARDFSLHKHAIRCGRSGGGVRKLRSEGNQEHRHGGWDRTRGKVGDREFGWELGSRSRLQGQEAQT